MKRDVQYLKNGKGQILSWQIKVEVKKAHLIIDQCNWRVWYVNCGEILGKDGYGFGGVTTNIQLISTRQYAFREGSLCITKLLRFYTRVVSVIHERECSIDCIYLALKKEVPLRWLLCNWKCLDECMGRYWIWYEKYLEGRLPRTVRRHVYGFRVEECRVECLKGWYWLQLCFWFT